jgi:predicted lipoprotein with Yx(FWY)xxD motif
MKSLLFDRKPILGISIVAILVLVLAACQPSLPQSNVPVTGGNAPNPVAPSTGYGSTGIKPTVPASAAMPASTGVVLNVATDAKLGKYLVDEKGMALYMYTKDEPDKSNCSAGCLKAWPPLVSGIKATAGAGVDAALIGSATLADGSKIVTYNKMPLYYWVKDTKPGDITGQDNNKVWYVVAPDGKPIGAPTSTTSTAAMPETSGVVLSVATDAKLGKFLVDGKGMALYMFTKDTPDKSNCSAGCLKAWPPLVSATNATAGAGVDASLIGSATLADGSKIVTYNKMPLYYWAGDAKPGDITGQGNNSVWFVVAPDGKPIGQ